MFDRLFAGLLGRSEAGAPMQLYQLANASAIYALGFMAVFIVFALLYHHAYRCRAALELSELEVFDTRSGIAHHLVSTTVGLISLLIATVAPLQFSPIAPAAFSLMGPFHWVLGAQSRKRRDALSARLALAATSVDAPASEPRIQQTSLTMRNAEVIRQWAILRDLESSRRVTIDDLAERTGVSTRTIRRDLEALQSAGFPLFDEVHDGKKYWTLEQRAFRRLDDTGFTLAEMTALYFSRSLVECLAATPFQRDVRSAFDKLAAALTPGMRQLLDRLPLVMQAKAEPGGQSTMDDPSTPATASKQSAPRSARVAELLDATLHHRRVTMRYHSFSSNREKDYLLEPYRLVFAQGGLYVVAYVPEYKQMRTFAVERIQSLSLTEERFEPIELPEDAFAHSLGVNQGTPERIEIAFEPRIARYVKERVWHASQQTTEAADGSLTMTLNVCNDWALRSWILGFGPLARVIAPPELASQILDEIDRTQIALRARVGFRVAGGRVNSTEGLRTVWVLGFYWFYWF